MDLRKQVELGNAPRDQEIIEDFMTEEREAVKERTHSTKRTDTEQIQQTKKILSFFAD